MSITNYPDADFTPDIPNSGANTGKQSYNPTGSFRFWAQKVLPTVYDDSLSYYEILTKVVNYLNAVIQNVDSLNDSVDNTNSAFDTLQEYVNSTKDTIISTYNELQDYVNTYFDSLDVQEEINTKLDGMASDGSLSELLAPFIPSLVSDWLSKNITPTSPAIDASLSISGAGADAKVTGELIRTIEGQVGDLRSDLFSLGEGFEEFDTTFIRGGLSDAGEVNNYISRIVTQDILHSEYPIFIKNMDSDYRFRVAFYDENGTFISFQDDGWCTEQYFIPANTYFRILIAKVNESSDPADISLFRTKVLKQTNYNYLIDSVLSYESPEILNYHIKKRILFKNYNASQGKFVVGGYRTIDTPIYYPFDIIVNNANSELYMFNVKMFRNSNPVAANYVASSGWVTNSFLVPKNTYFTVEYTTKNASVAPLPSISATLELLTFSPAGMASDIVYSAVDLVISESDGFYSVDGYIVAPSNNQEVYTQKYPTQKDMKYNVSLEYSVAHDMWGAYALYDENENFISRTIFANVNSAKRTFDIVINDDDAAYISFCYRTYGDIAVNITSFNFNKFSSRGIDLLNRKARSYDYSVNEHIKSINHRGYNTEAPENTLPAYKLSRQYGYKYVECDVSFTSDDVAVLLHDATINRTARNADGTEIADTTYIENITYEQALTYDFGIWKGSKWTGVKIPTFEQFITLCRNIGLHPYIEIKEQGMSESHVNQIVDIVRNCGMAKDVTWISFMSTALQYVLAKNPKARIGLLANTVDSTVIETARGLMTNNNDVFINSGSHTNDEVILCQNANIPMEVWNFALRDVIASLPTYVTGITSDINVAGYILYQKNILI